MMMTQFCISYSHLCREKQCSIWHQSSRAVYMSLPTLHCVSMAADQIQRLTHREGVGNSFITKATTELIEQHRNPQKEERKEAFFFLFLLNQPQKDSVHSLYRPQPSCNGRIRVQQRITYCQIMYNKISNNKKQLTRLDQRRTRICHCSGLPGQME